MSKIQHAKNQENLTSSQEIRKKTPTQMTQMLELSEKDLRNEKIESLSREIEDIEHTQIKFF